MGKTYRRLPPNGRWLRNPKGRKKALVNNARKKAIPPDAWDDYIISAMYESDYKKGEE